MGALAAKIPLVSGEFAALLQKRAENMLLESDKEGPLAWLINLLQEYGVCVEPPEDKDDSEQQFSSDGLDMYEVIASDASNAKFGDITEENAAHKLQWHSRRQNQDGVAAQGFALNLTENGSSISFPPNMTKLNGRHNGILVTKTRQATSSATLKYEIGTTYSLRVELETPGMKKSVERSVLMNLKGLLVYGKINHKAPFELLRAGQYGNEFESIQVVGLFSSGVAISSMVLLEALVDPEAKVECVNPPARFDVSSLDGYKAWIDKLAKADINAQKITEVMLNQIAQLRVDPKIILRDENGETEETNLLHDFLNEAESSMLQDHYQGAAFTEDRVTTLTDDVIDILWGSAGPVNKDDECCTFVRPKNFFAEYTLPLKYDFETYLSQALTEDIEEIPASGVTFHIIPGKNDKAEQASRTPKELGNFIPEIKTFPVSFDAARMAFSERLFVALSDLSSDAKQDRANKFIEKLETLKGEDPPLNMRNHPPIVRKLPGWLSSLLDFCVEAAKAGKTKERAVGLKTYFQEGYASWMAPAAGTAKPHAPKRTKAVGRQGPAASSRLSPEDEASPPDFGDYDESWADFKKLIDATAAGVTRVFKEVAKDKVNFPEDKHILAKVTVDELVTKLRDAVLPQEGTGDEGKVGELQATISALEEKVSELQTESDKKEKEFLSAMYDKTKEMVDVKLSLEQQLENSEERFAWLSERVVDIAEKLGPEAWQAHFKAIEARCKALRRNSRLAARWNSAASDEKLEETFLETLRLPE